MLGMLGNSILGVGWVGGVMVKIAIDPGALGGIAWRINGSVDAIKMPDTPMDILDNLKAIVVLHNATCCIEKVGGYMPGNSGPAAVKFARHCGHIDMALLAAGIPHTTVTPAKWEHWLIGKPNYPKIPKSTPVKERSRILAKRKTERKNKIKQAVQARYPHLKITLATADALGILAWMER